MAASSAPLPVYELFKASGAILNARDAAGWNLLHFGAKHQSETAIIFGRRNGLDPAEKARKRKDDRNSSQGK